LSRPFLPYARQSIDESDIAAVSAALRGELLTTGPSVAAFEKALAARVDAPFAVSCNSATAGLHLAALALGLGPGDVAIVPTVTFLATANAVRYAGAEVVFADVDPDTGLMTPETFEAAIARAPSPPKAAFPVHLNGQPCDMAQLRGIADRHAIRLVEDAAHALGATLGNAAHPVGTCTHSDMAVFSFHPVKAVAMGEGGAVTTRDPEMARSLARFRSHGMVREPAAFRDADLSRDAGGAVNPWYYEMHEFGWNYRASDLNCALGLSQLGRLEQFLARRSAIAATYDRLLAPLAPTLRPVPRVQWGRSGWHLYAVLVDFAAAGKSRAAVMNELRERHGVGTQVHYLPVHLQPYYRARYGHCDLPGSLAYYERVMAIPFYPALPDEDVERVAGALAEVLG
jgi:UDP-4-amino-4,6-dideoxy-N-acetyl-beta-L-altrosamine transaminase